MPLMFVLHCALRVNICSFIPMEEYWCVKPHWSVSFFVWTPSFGGKILTCDNLIKRDYMLLGWCCMYWCNGEMVDHLLFHCIVAWILEFCS